MKRAGVAVLASVVAGGCAGAPLSSAPVDGAFHLML
jgi:hypothetical protein